MQNACVIFEDDLMSYMDIFSHVAAYRFDELDEYAVRAGIRGTDSEEEKWFEYPMIGEKCRLHMRLAYTDSGSCVLACQLEGDESVLEQIRHITDALELLSDRFYFLPTRFYQKDVCIESGRTIEVYRRKGGPGG